MKKIIFVISFIVLSGFLFGLSASDTKAQTVTELQAQIQQLMAQIAQLQAKLGQLQPAPITWCHNFNVNLGVGNRGPEVTALQTALQKEGLYQRTISGIFDQYTASAVVAFQEKYASEVLAPWRLTRGTGYVGPSTRTKLNKLYECKITPKGERWALLVASSAQTPPELTEEASRFKNILVDNGWKEDHIKVLKGDDLTNESFISAIGWLADKSDSNDIVFLSIFAHGSENGLLIEEEAYGYGEDFTYSRLSEELDKIKYGGFMIRLRACFGNYAFPYLKKENRVILHVSRTDEVLRALMGFGDVAGNKDGWVSAEEIYNFLNYSGDNPGSPLIQDDYPGELNIVNIGKRFQNLDQYNMRENPRSGSVVGARMENQNSWIAQSFRPNYSVLDKVILPVIRIGNPGPLTVSIRKDLSGIDLTSVTLPQNKFYENYGYGNEIDFPDIQIIPSETYYLVIRAPNAIWEGHDKRNQYVIEFSDANNYPKGKDYPGGELFTWYSTSKEWFSMSDNDLYFEDWNGKFDLFFATFGKKIEKSIIVISPNGGEQWQIGKTYPITWESQGISKVDISACRSEDPFSCVRIGPNEGVDARLGKYDWTIKQLLAFVEPGSRLKIKIIEYNNPAVRDFSDNYFSIASEVPTCPDWSCSYINTHYLATIQKFDEDGDGQISMSELSAAIYDWRYGNTTHNEMCAVQNAWQKGCKFAVILLSPCDNYGDVNQDGKLDNTDASWISQYIAGTRTFTQEQKLRADLNQDEKIDVLDLTMLKQYLDGNIAIIPACYKSSPCGNYGDLNNNGFVNLRDVELITSCIVDKLSCTSEHRRRADLNNDGKVDILDLTILRRYIAGLDTTFPICQGGVGFRHIENQLASLVDVVSGLIEQLKSLIGR